MNIIDFLEDLYLRYKRFISFIFSVMSTILYYFGFIGNFSLVFSNIVAFLAALLVIITLILTLLLHLKDKEKYINQIKNFKNGDKEIFQFMLKIIISNIMCMASIIFISLLSPSILSLVIKIFILFVVTFLLSYTTLGSLYMLFFAVDIVTNIDNEEQRKGMS